MTVKVGQKYRPKDGVCCGNFRSNKKAVGIKITEIRLGEALEYIFLDKKGMLTGDENSLGNSCYGCFEAKDLLPWNENKIGETTMNETMKTAKFGVVWNEDKDPIEFFNTEEEAKARIEVLVGKEDVERGSIYLFEVSNVQQVRVPVEYALVSVNPPETMTMPTLNP